METVNRAAGVPRGPVLTGKRGLPGKRVGFRRARHYNARICSKSSKSSWGRSRRSSRICGGFFDVPDAQKRLAELDTLMAADSFWNNREQAQKLIDEANSIRKKIDPLFKAVKQLEDL